MIVQRDQAYARGYTIDDKPENRVHKAGTYSYAHHVKICQHPSRLLKFRCEARLRKKNEKAVTDGPPVISSMLKTTLMAHSSWQDNTDQLLPKKQLPIKHIKNC